MKVLQLYYKMPFPRQDGGAYSIYSASLSLLSQGIDLRILAMDTVRHPGDLDLIPEDFLRATRFEAVTVDNSIKPGAAILNMFRNASYFCSRFYSEIFRQRLLDRLSQEDFDIIQLEHLCLCQYLDDIRKSTHARIVLRAQNVENQVWSEYSQHLPNPLLRKYISMQALRLERFEQQVSARIDGVIALTEEDAAYFRNFTGRERVVTIPVGVDTGNLPEPETTSPSETFPTIYHLGSMDWQPNIQGLKWFVEKVLPIAVTAMPDITVSVAGRNMPDWFFRQRSKNLVVEGVVDNAISYQSKREIMIVPLLSGSGIRVKILEGMALGKTIISTSVGAKGIAAVHDESILIADTPEEFARQLCRCAASPSLCRQIGGHAREVAAEYYNIEAIGHNMIHYYQSLVTGFTRPVQKTTAGCLN